MEEQLLDTWRIHNRINLYLLAEIDPNSLDAVSASKGRTVREQFAHIHNVRLLWLKQAGPALCAKLDKLEKEKKPNKEVLQKSLEDSSAAIEELLHDCLGAGKKVKGFKP